MVDYAALRDRAAELIDQYGTAVVHRVTTMPEYIPGEEYSHTIAVQHGRGVVLDFDESDRAGGLVQLDDRQLLLSTQGIAAPPSPGDSIEIGGQTYGVISVKTERPADITLYYSVRVRR